MNSPRNFLAHDFLANELLPELVSLGHDVLRKSRVLSLAVECKLIFRLAVGHFVELEPFDRGSQKSREELLNIFNIVQLISNWISHVDSEELPVSLALVDQRECSQDLDLHNVSALGDARADFANVDGIVVAFAAGGLIDVIRILPRLRQGAVVPNVALVWENVGHIAQFALLDVLLDWIERLVQGDLKEKGRRDMSTFDQSISSPPSLRSSSGGLPRPC